MLAEVAAADKEAEDIAAKSEKRGRNRISSAGGDERRGDGVADAVGAGAAVDAGDELVPGPDDDAVADEDDDADDA